MVRQSPAELVMEAELGNGYLFSRTITLSGRKMTVTSSLKNISDKSQKTVLRAHPKVCLGKSPAEDQLYVREADGNWREVKMPMGDYYLRGKDFPAGAWQVRNERLKIGVTNTFSPDQVGDCYVCGCADFYTWELMGKPVTLEPGKSFTLTHSYEFFDL